jgi:hypothetical protein
VTLTNFVFDIKYVPPFLLTNLDFKIALKLLGKIDRKDKDWIMLHNITIFGTIKV